MAQGTVRFDVVIVSDFRFPGGTSTAISHEIRALHRGGYSVGLLQKNAPLLKKKRPSHADISACLEAGQALLIRPADQPEIACRLAVLHNPYVFTGPDPKLPKIDAGQAILVAQQPVINAQGTPYYDVWAVQRTAAALAGPVTWAPISPLSRLNMEKARLPFGILREDWSHVVMLEDWAGSPRTAPARRPSIGRHSRPEREKWPATREDILAVYPDSEEFDVRLLGVGPALDAIMGTPLPANWTTLEFGAVAPAAFLNGLDFFVYFHHPDWVEGFGRAIAEAAASGAVVILPEYLRPTFAEAALYCEPVDALAQVHALCADPAAYAAQSRAGRDTIGRLYGPERFLARIERLIGKPGAVQPGLRSSHAGGSSGLQPAAPAREFDILHIGDLRTPRGPAYRIANLVEVEASRGYASGLIHVNVERASPATIHPQIDELVWQGKAAPIHPYEPNVTAKLAVIHNPMRLLSKGRNGQLFHRPIIAAERWIAILDKIPDLRRLEAADAFLRDFFAADISWTTTERAALEAVTKAGGVRVESDVWAPAVNRVAKPDWGGPRSSVPVLGFLSTGAPGDPADSAARLARYLHSFADKAIVRLMDPPKLPGYVDLWGPGVEVFTLEDMSIRKFLAGLDFLVATLPPGASHPLPPDAMALAMGLGTVVVLPPSQKQRFGEGPLYLRPDRVGDVASAIHSDPQRMTDLRATMTRYAAEAFSPAPHQRRLGPVRRAQAEPTLHRDRPKPRERILFLSSNGVGLGHLTRLLAIARRMPADLQPVFATMSQAISVVEQAGYPVEYIPFHVYANCDPRDWNGWLAQQLGAVLDFHRPRALVFDGTSPYGGLLKAVGPRSDVQSVWIRRGMWQERQDNSEALRRERFFSLVVAPGDIAESLDRGATTQSRSRVQEVAPIRLLDADELLDRARAAGRLGLDPSRPAVLIQLGSGWSNDQAAMVDTILAALAERPHVQPVLLEWLIAHNEAPLWPEVLRLRGFPVTKYYNAFDFTISAAGYNSFNEIISFGLPAIFVPNDHQMMDDQVGRANYAVQQGAGLQLARSDIAAIGPLLDSVLNRDNAAAMKMNCLRLARENGAEAAAAAITRLLGSAP